MTGVRHHACRFMVVALLAAGWMSVASSADAANGQSTPAKWSATLCSSLTTWQDAIKESADQFSTDVAGDSDLEAGRAHVVGFVDRLISLSGATAAQIHQLGAPRVRNGKKLADAIAQGFQSTDAALATAKQQAVALPTDDPDTYSDGLDPLTDTLLSVTDPVTEAVDKINSLDSSGQLLKVFAKQKSCKPYVL